MKTLWDIWKPFVNILSQIILLVATAYWAIKGETSGAVLFATLLILARLDEVETNLKETR